MVDAYTQNRHQPPIRVWYKITDILSMYAKDLLVENKKKIGLQTVKRVVDEHLEDNPK